MATRRQTPKRTGAEELPKEPEIMLRIGSLLEKFEQQIQEDDFKMSVADYMRLIQMKQDLDSTAPRNIEVSWVDTMDRDGKRDG